MTQCSNRLSWANGKPIGGPYEQAQCFECLAWAELETIKAPFGLPGEVQVLKAHDRAQLWKHWRCHVEWWTCDAMGHDAGCPFCESDGELIEEVRK